MIMLADSMDTFKVIVYPQLIYIMSIIVAYQYSHISLLLSLSLKSMWDD